MASARFPAWDSAARRNASWEAVLSSGDVLVLPANWLHHVTSMPSLPADGEADVSVSVNLWRQCPSTAPRCGSHWQLNPFKTGCLPQDYSGNSGASDESHRGGNGKRLR